MFKSQLFATVCFVALMFMSGSGHAITVDTDGDGVDDSVDVCPATVIPESLPTTGILGRGRYALKTPPVFDKKEGRVAVPDFTTADTGGCSCDQILDAVGHTRSQDRRGCTLGTMRAWADSLVKTADLSISKTDSVDPIDAGETLVYTIMVSNAGPDEAENVVVTDTLPAGVTFVATNGCDNDPSGVPSCELGNILSGNSKQYTIEVTVDAGTSGTIINSASVSSDADDPNLGDNSVTEETTVSEPVPGANDDTKTVTEDDPATTIDVLANDDNAGSASITGITQPDNGTVINNTTNLTYEPDADYCNDATPTDDFTYTITGGSSATVRVTVTCVNDPPVGVDDNYNGIGNTQFELVAALSGSTPVPPTMELVGTVGDNDQDPDGDTVGALPGTVGTTQGGSVTIDSDGRFIYTPPAGFTGGDDTFSYTPTDGTAAAASTALVTISLADIVWYVDDSSPNNPGLGTSDEPFRNLSSAGGPSLVGHTIFVHSGTQTTGIALQNNQSLIGEGVGLIVNATLLVDAGVRPVIANAGGTAIMLGSDNTIRGLDITGSNTGISGTAFGTLSADTVAISTSGGPGIDLSNGAGSVTFDSLSSSGSSGSGIDLNSVSGSFTFGSGSISGSSGAGVRIADSPATVTYDGTISTVAPRPVDIIGPSGGSVTFGGAIATTSGDGINISSASGTFTFKGGVDLTTTTATGFNATGGGTVNVCADDNCDAAGGTGVVNIVDTVGVKAVNIQNTLLGAGGVTFHDVAVNGASAGIDIESAGSGGFFTVSGGLIENTTVNGILIENTDNITISNTSLTDAADDNAGCSTVAFDCNAAIEFNSVSTVDLSNITILRSDEHGIFGTNVTDLDLTNVSITDAGNGTDSSEHGIFIRNLLGTVAGGTDSRFDNVDINNSASNGIFVENTLGTSGSAAQPDLLTVTGTSSVSNHGQNSGIIVETDAAPANLKLDVQAGYQSTNNSTRGLSANANTGRLQVTVDGATFGGGGHFTGIAGGSAGAGGSSSELILNLTNNNITQSCPGAVCPGTGPGGITFSSFSTGGNNGTMRGTIQGNTISSVAANIVGISLINEGNSTANRFLIDNNNIQLTYAGPEGEVGMDLRSRTLQGAMDLVITNNTVNIPGAMSTLGGGIAMLAGNGTPGEANTLCIDMSANNVSTPAMDAASGGFDLSCQIVAFVGNTMEVEGMSAPFSDANLETYIESVNTSCGTDAGVTAVVTLLGATLTSGNCVAP